VLTLYKKFVECVYTTLTYLLVMLITFEVNTLLANLLLKTIVMS